MEAYCAGSAEGLAKDCGRLANLEATVRVGAAKQILADRLAEFLICADWPNSLEIYAGQWRNARTTVREPYADWPQYCRQNLPELG